MAHAAALSRTSGGEDERLGEVQTGSRMEAALAFHFSGRNEDGSVLVKQPFFSMGDEGVESMKGTAQPRQ